MSAHDPLEVFAEDSLEALLLCARSWEPEARLVGNVRAATIAQLCEELIKDRSDLAEANNRWHSACDVGRRLEVRNGQLSTELAEATAQLEKFKDWCASAKPARKTPLEQAVLDAAHKVGLGYANGAEQYPFMSVGIVELARAVHELQKASK